MFTSTFNAERCQLFCVVRTDLMTYDTVTVPGYVSNYSNAVAQARGIQDLCDPDYEHYDYRVGMCS
jgi:hypothetical protein